MKNMAQPGPRKLFTKRMMREGRHDEFAARIKDYQYQGDTYSQARYKVMREMGYESAEQERDFAEDHENDLAKERIQGDRELFAAMKRDEAKRNLEDEEFKAKVKALPERDVNLKKDFTFIFHHPAMSRAFPKVGGIKLTAEDVKDAPSRGAAILLRHYCCGEPYRKDFYTAAIKEFSKGPVSTVESDLDAQEERSIAEIRAMLKRLPP